MQRSYTLDPGIPVGTAGTFQGTKISSLSLVSLAHCQLCSVAGMCAVGERVTGSEDERGREGGREREKEIEREREKRGREKVTQTKAL